MSWGINDDIYVKISSNEHLSVSYPLKEKSKGVKLQGPDFEIDINKKNEIIRRELSKYYPVELVRIILKELKNLKNPQNPKKGVIFDLSKIKISQKEKIKTIVTNLIKLAYISKRKEDNLTKEEIENITNKIITVLKNNSVNLDKFIQNADLTIALTKRGDKVNFIVINLPKGTKIVGYSNPEELPESYRPGVPFF